MRLQTSMRFEHLVRALAAPALAGLALFAAGCVNDATSPAPKPRADAVASMARVEGSHRHVINMRTPNTESAVLDAVRLEGGTVDADHGDVGLVTVSGLSEEAAARIAARLDVAAVAHDMELQWLPPVDQGSHTVEADAALAPGTQPNADQSGAAFFATYQWNMRQIKAIDAQRTTPAGDGTTVCVLDTGVDPGHLDLNGRVDVSISTSFVPSEPFIEDLHFHGSFVSALIASNGIAMASVAPNTRLCAVKVLAFTGSGSFASVIDGIAYAATSKHHGGAGANVLNMSFGAYVDRTQPGVNDLIDAIQKAVNYAWRHGVVMVVAAGNAGIDLRHDGPQFLSIPAELHHIVNVGATAPVNQMNFDLLASYSNYGTTDLSAPGGDLVAGGSILDLVLSVCSRFSVYFNCASGRSYLLGAGTSFAAPHVTGGSAVLLSVSGKGEDDDRETEKIVGALKHGADKVGPRLFFGAGRLNVLRSVAALHHHGDD